jgi:hypothetical protein
VKASSWLQSETPCCHWAMEGTMPTSSPTPEPYPVCTYAHKKGRACAFWHPGSTARSNCTDPVKASAGSTPSNCHMRPRTYCMIPASIHKNCSAAVQCSSAAVRHTLHRPHTPTCTSGTGPHTTQGRDCCAVAVLPVHCWCTADCTADCTVDCTATVLALYCLQGCLAAGNSSAQPSYK